MLTAICAGGRRHIKPLIGCTSLHYIWAVASLVVHFQKLYLDVLSKSLEGRVKATFPQTMSQQPKKKSILSKHGSVWKLLDVHRITVIVSEKNKRRVLKLYTREFLSYEFELSFNILLFITEKTITCSLFSPGGEQHVINYTADRTIVSRWKHKRRMDEEMHILT